MSMFDYDDWTKRDCVRKYEMSPDGGPALCWDDCHVGDCKTCGWNPFVVAERRRQLRAQVDNGERPHVNTKVVNQELINRKNFLNDLKGVIYAQDS